MRGEPWGSTVWLGIAFTVSVVIAVVGVYGLALSVDASGRTANIFGATLGLGTFAMIVTGVLLLFEIYSDR